MKTFFIILGMFAKFLKEAGKVLKKGLSGFQKFIDTIAPKPKEGEGGPSPSRLATWKAAYQRGTGQTSEQEADA